MAALYVCLLGILFLLLRQLPTRGALSAKAGLPVGDPLLMKLPRNITELRAVWTPVPKFCSINLQ